MTKRDAARKIHPALGRSYWARSLAYMAGSILVVSCIPPENSVTIRVVLFFGFVYPTLFYQAGIRMKDTRTVGFIGYGLDSVLWALAVIFCHYGIVILLVAPQLALTSAVLMLGVRRGLIYMAIMAVIMAVGLLFVPVELTARYSNLQMLYGWAIVLGFMFYISFLVNNTTRSFVTARRELQDRNRQVEAQAQQLASISEVAKVVNSTLDLDEVMAAIMEGLHKVFSFTQMTILFLDPEEQTLKLHRVAGDVPPDLLEKLEGLDIPMSEESSAFVRTAQARQPGYLADVESSSGSLEGVSKQIYRFVPAKSLLTFPLISGDEVIGVLAFANTRDYFQLDENDINHIGRYVTYVVSSLRNASDYEEIQQSRAAADAANNAKSQFLANMSHELRTPMNAVIGYSEMLEEEAEDQGLNDFIPDLQKIRSASRHLLKLINDVLDLSKIEAEKVELYPEHFGVEEMLTDIEATVQPLIKEKNNQLWIKKVNRLGEVFVDQTKLRQVTLNLLSNAAKFTSSGIIRLTAERVEDQSMDWLVIEVQDSGIGMSEEQLEHVFDPFTQGDASTTREFGGTGLGLTISRKFCEMMGGSLTAKSKAGAGSTFVLRLPVEADRGSGVPGAVSASEESAGLQAPTVLVIDDDASIRDLMNRHLTRAGYKVATAADGREGLEKARELMPRVITLDVLMPGQDGWSILNELKSDPDLANIPVVMQTILDDSRKGYALGASEFLTKPIDRARITEVIERLHKSPGRVALVVEDDPDIRQLVSLWLQAEEWEVHTAENGRKGLEAWAQYGPNLVILDLMMPEVDGFEFMDEIREQAAAGDITIIVVTAKDLTPAEIEFLNGGVEHIIRKASLPVDEIINEIRRHLD